LTEHSLFFRFTFYVLPWITYVVFVLGMAFVIKKWFSGVPSEPVGKKEGGKGNVWGTIKAFVLNLIVQRRTLKKNPGSISLWVIGWLMFHIALFFILFGHFRSVGVWDVEWFTWLASENFWVKTLPYFIGFVLLAGAVLLLLRRIVLTAPRAISTSGNYIVLLLLLVVIVAGIMMRILHHSPAAFDVTIPPGFTMDLETTPSLVWLTIHAFIGQIIFMYLPFSGLVHIVGSIITALASARGESKTKRNTKVDAKVAQQPH
jgi:nitrate reductase gamma subunit